MNGKDCSHHWVLADVSEALFLADTLRTEKNLAPILKLSLTSV